MRRAQVKRLHAVGSATLPTGYIRTGGLLIILAFPNNPRKERRFLPGLKAGVSAPNI
jgi:hypothetical protein